MTKLQLSDYILIAMLAALGLVLKGIIVPIAQILCGPFFIPGGVLAGGFYMMFLVLGHALVGKRGAAFLVSLVQAILVTTTGTFGSHGPMSLFTYTASGMGVELWFFLSGHRGCCPSCCFVAGVVANTAGTLAVNLALFNLPLVPLALSLSVATLSGGLGGLMANLIATNLKMLPRHGQM